MHKVMSPRIHEAKTDRIKWGIESSTREGNGTPLQYSYLENPMDGGAWWAAVHGVAKNWTRLSNFTFTFHFPALEKEMATHINALAWRIPGTGEPGGLPSMGSHRVGHDWSDIAAIVGDFTIPLLIRDRRTRQMIYKKTEDFNNISIKHSNQEQLGALFFRCTSCVFSSTYMLGHKTSVNKFWKTEMKDAFSNNSRIKLEIKNRKKFGKFINMWELTYS